VKGKEMPGAAAAQTARAADAALTIIRLFRSMERLEAGLTPQQYRMLKFVGAGGERSAKLAERLAVAKPTLTSTADGLVAAGLLNRETETTDRRVVRLTLTEAGRAAVDRADAVYAEWLGALLRTAGDEDALLRDFARIEHAIDERLAARQAARATGAGHNQASDQLGNEGQASRPASPRKKSSAADAQSARRSSM
jgi:DNA-binding MarR family transcriptional regulator